MNNISFGQYVPGNSWIYKLDPRLKIILTVLMIVLIFLIPSLLGMAIALGVFILIFLSTRISFIKVLKGLKPVLFLLLFTVVLQLVYTTGDNYTLLYSFDMQIGLFNLLIIVGILAFYFLTKRFIPFRFIYLLICLAGVFMVLWYVRFDMLVWSDFKFDVYNEGVEKAGFILIRILIMKSSWVLSLVMLKE